MAEPGTLEKPSDAGGGGEGLVKYWNLELDLADKQERDWRKRADKVVERYRDDRKQVSEDGTTPKRQNILWANVETLKPTIYSNTPSPDVRRRFLDEDDAARDGAMIIERALSFAVDDTDFDDQMQQVRDDVLLPGRGVARVRMDSRIARLRPQRRSVTDPAGGEDVEVFVLDDGRLVEPDGEDGDGPFVEEVAEQRVFPEYVFWKDFRVFPAGWKQWEDVYGVGFRHLLTRDELTEKFGAAGGEVPLTHTSAPEEHKEEQHARPLKKAEVWEIWDRRARRVVWLARDFDRPLDVEDDPLGLEGFFPVPRPIYAVKTTDSGVPIPEFTIYQDQADELDRVTDRLHRLVEASKAVGIYAAVHSDEMQLLQDASDGDIVPARVEEVQRIIDNGGIDKLVAWWPIKDIAEVITVLSARQAELKQQIFEITGISDIIRGATKASETASAQELKGRFGQLRFTPRARPMQTFVRDILRMMGEIVAEHFTPVMLGRMTGLEIDAQTVELLRSEKLRRFRVDIETDSTVEPDAQQNKQEAMEFTTAISGLFRQAIEAAGQTPELAPLVVEMVRFNTRRFKVGRQMEDTIDETLQALVQKAQQPQPDPEERKARIDLEKQQAELRIKQAELQLQAQSKAADMELDREKAEAEMARKDFEATHEAAIDRFKAEQDAEIKGGEAVTDDEIKRFQASTDAELAEAKAAVDMEMARRKGDAEAKAKRANGEGSEE